MSNEKAYTLSLKYTGETLTGLTPDELYNVTLSAETVNDTKVYHAYVADHNSGEAIHDYEFTDPEELLNNFMSEVDVNEYSDLSESFNCTGVPALFDYTGSPGYYHCNITDIQYSVLTSRRPELTAVWNLEHDTDYSEINDAVIEPTNESSEAWLHFYVYVQYGKVSDAGMDVAGATNISSVAIPLTDSEFNAVTELFHDERPFDKIPDPENYPEVVDGIVDGETGRRIEKDDDREM